MQTIGRHLYTLISRGINCCGSFDPNEVMPYIEEDLTGGEYKDISGFLTWVHEDESTRAFGHGNYEERFSEYKNQLK